MSQGFSDYQPLLRWARELWPGDEAKGGITSRKGVSVLKHLWQVDTNICCTTMDELRMAEGEQLQELE